MVPDEANSVDSWVAFSDDKAMFIVENVAFWALIKMGGLGPVDWSSFLVTVAMAGERVLLPWFPIGLLMELRADRVPL
ncbi:hypothetical protein PRIPAC_96187 [Pristionchus pacificus]|uniref:Uncharacterized protein n=1 Tax=Pristionchus pacificus TaxID=54126 RepID=A0A2A6CGY9_PRIPA|nr:hypothetical protein PRIPAC_96187 [Pristionchus pacificus]|eukprot:PDM77399.1 hypothetical protein PRIPAC_33129 [Pristionchus pacificus]